MRVSRLSDINHRAGSGVALAKKKKLKSIILGNNSQVRLLKTAAGHDTRFRPLPPSDEAAKLLGAHGS
jgi:hypothetical protein